MKLYQIHHSNMDSTGVVNHWIGKLFLNEENAKSYIDDYAKLLLPFEEVYGMDMDTYAQIYNEALGLVSRECNQTKSYDEMEGEVFKVMASKLNKAPEEIKTMDLTYDLNAMCENIPTIKEIETED